MHFSHRLRCSLTATTNQVFRALTEPAQLTAWFAEGAQVEPHMGGVYRFWGRHTLGTPPQDAARQTITRYEPDVALAFDWPINEIDTDVLMQLEATSKGTELTLTHNVSVDLRLPHQRELIDHFWRLAMQNLEAHLKGDVVTMPDYFDLQAKHISGAE